MPTDLQEALQEQSSGLADLRSVMAGATQWRDTQRAQLEKGRIDPLLEVGTNLLQALRRTDQEISRARRQMG